MLTNKIKFNKSLTYLYFTSNSLSLSALESELGFICLPNGGYITSVATTLPVCDVTPNLQPFRKPAIEINTDNVKIHKIKTLYFIQLGSKPHSTNLMSQ
jgi:hypothetical protein